MHGSEGELGWATTPSILTQVRGEISLYRHWILVFCAYTFIHWHWLTGGLRRQWANKLLTTFVEALEAFRTAVSYRFFHWLQDNIDL